MFPFTLSWSHSCWLSRRSLSAVFGARAHSSLKHIWAYPGRCPLLALNWNRQLHWPHVTKAYDSLYYMAGTKANFDQIWGTSSVSCFQNCSAKGVLMNIQNGTSIQCSHVTVPVAGALDSLFACFTCFPLYHLTLNKMVVLNINSAAHTIFF